MSHVSRRWRTAEGLVRAMRLSRSVLAGIAAVAMVPALLVVPVPLLVHRAFELATTATASAPLAWTVAGIVGLLLVGEAIAGAIRVTALRVTKAGTQRLRVRLAEAVEALPFDEVETRGPHIHDVGVNDVNRVDLMMASLIAFGLPAALLAIGLSGALAFVHIGFGLATLTAAGVVAIAERAMRSRMRRAIDESHGALGSFSHQLWAAIDRVSSTRAHAAEAREVRILTAAADELRTSSLRASETQAIGISTGRAITAVVFGALVLIATLLVQQGAVSIPEMLAVSAAIALLRAPLNTLSFIAPPVQEGWRAWQRVYALLETGDRARSAGGPLPPAGALEVSDLSGGIGDAVLFEDVTFSLAPGEVVAVMGPNGAGKSTLVTYLLGLRPPRRGSVRIGGASSVSSDRDAWRRAFGVVLQRTAWFDGTIRDNLTYGAEDATPADVRDACDLARVTEMLDSWPAGLETLVGRGGIRLSEGQAQRLAIARALVRRPRFLILDEPTTHLEDGMGAEILSRILARASRPGILLITHQPELARVSDRVVVLISGRLASPGLLA